MNKAALIDLVKINLSGGDAPAQIKGVYHPNVISHYLELVYNDMIFASYMLGEKTGDYSEVDNYTQPYFVTIAYDSVRDAYYAILPVQPVQLPNNFGIRQVSPQKDELNPLAPVDNVANAVFNVLEVSFIDNTPTYYYEGTRLWFNNLPKGLENLLVKLIAGFNALTPTDEVFIPGGNNVMVFQKVCEIMLKKPPAVNQDNMVSKQV